MSSYHTPCTLSTFLGSCYASFSPPSLRKHPFLLALRRWGRSSARNVPSDEERGETDVFAGYSPPFQFQEFLLALAWRVTSNGHRSVAAVDIFLKLLGINVRAKFSISVANWTVLAITAYSR